MDIVKQADEFAEKAHRGQYRKDGKTQYIQHSRRVAELYRLYYNIDGFVSQEALAVCLLHDVCENSGITYDTLVHEFNSVIADSVVALSKHSAESKIDYYKRMRTECNATEKCIKLCDRLANLEDTFKLVSSFNIDENRRFGLYYIRDSINLFEYADLYSKTDSIFTSIFQTLCDIGQECH